MFAKFLRAFWHLWYTNSPFGREPGLSAFWDVPTLRGRVVDDAAIARAPFSGSGIMRTKARLRRQTITMPMTSGSTSVEHIKPLRPPLAHLPGEDGWPIVGNTFAALKDPVHHVEAMYRKHGAVYRDHLFGVRSVAMLGPEANELVLFDRDKNFSSSKGWGFLLDQLFPRGLMLMDFRRT